MPETAYIAHQKRVREVNDTGCKGSTLTYGERLVGEKMDHIRSVLWDFRDFVDRNYPAPAHLGMNDECYPYKEEEEIYVACHKIQSKLEKAIDNYEKQQNEIDKIEKLQEMADLDLSEHFDFLRSQESPLHLQVYTKALQLYVRCADYIKEKLGSSDNFLSKKLDFTNGFRYHYARSYKSTTDILSSYAGHVSRGVDEFQEEMATASGAAP